MSDRQVINGYLTNKDQALFEIKCKDGISIYIGTYEAFLFFDLVKDVIMDTSTYLIELHIDTSSSLVEFICLFLIKSSIYNYTPIISEENMKKGIDSMVKMCDQIIEFVDYMGLTKRGKPMNELIDQMKFAISLTFNMEGIEDDSIKEELIEVAISHYFVHSNNHIKIEGIKHLIKHIQCGIFDYFPIFSIARLMFEDVKLELELEQGNLLPEKSAYHLMKLVIENLRQIEVSFMTEGQRVPILLYKTTESLILRKINLKGIPFVQTEPDDIYHSISILFND